VGIFDFFRKRGERRAVVEELEPRILYSADLNPAATPELEPTAAVEVRSVEQEAAAGTTQTANEVTQPATDRSREILFVDAAVLDADALVRDFIATRGENAEVEVVQLCADRDGLAQITEALAGEGDVSTVHILAAGEPGALQLGNSAVDVDTLRNHAGEIAGWAASLTDDAGILIWSADAGGPDQAFMQELAALTGADVAASDEAASAITAGASIAGWIESTDASALAPTQDAATVRHELVFIDSRITNYEELIAGLNPAAEVIVLDRSLDGIAQIAAALQGRSDIDAIHFIGEGTSAELHLGGSFLTQESIAGSYAQQLRDIGTHLAADADILIYGCNFGAGDVGAQAMQTLAQLTGADIAASTDRTGHASEHGDWVLEASTGHIEAAVAVTAEAQQNWVGALATYTVTNTNNSGAGSLRQAILDANASAGSDTIIFNIAGAGPHTINVGAGGLPDITDTVIIDGWSEPDFAGTPIIELNGTSAGAGVHGLNLTGGAGSVIRGLVINRFGGDALNINVAGVTVVGNYLGTDVTGTVDLGNTDDGVDVDANNVVIGGTTAAERNIISGNNGDGINLGAGFSGAIIRGNYIGTDVTGTIDLGNSANGILVGGSNVTIGGTAAGARNIISGNGVDGINVASGANNVTIAGNWIGTGGTGTTGVGNSDDGIDIAGSSAIITNNVITNNADEGITIVGSGVTGHLIQGNIIGLDPDGSTNNGLGDVGIAIISGTGNTIGGTTAAARNVISRMAEGIEINTSNNIVQGNYIGTDATGTLNRGNRSSDGVQIRGSSTGNVIGGTVAGAGNLIAFNAQDGVDVENGTGHAVLGNQIHSNTQLGINLGTAGVTNNDAAPDSDSGANNLQNFPVLTRAVTNTSNRFAVGGTLASAVNTYYRIEIFSNTASDSSGNGEGQTYLGFVNVLTDGSGNATWSTEITANVAAGAVISATATKLDASFNPVETSEFAANITAVNQTLIVTNTTDTINGTTTSVAALIAAPGADGISLREAITAANNTTGVDLIVFNLALTDANHLYYRDNGVTGTFGTPVTTTLTDAAITDFDADYAVGTARSWYRISLSGSNLDVTEAVIIDGSTQSGYDSAKGPIIEIDASGVNAPASDFNAIVLTTGASTIRGLVINGAGDQGIEVDGGADNSIIVGNYIGTDVSGTKADPNLWGGIGVKADNVIVGGTSVADRNLISGNGGTVNQGWGIEIYNSAVGTIVRGNYIGTTITGTGALGNAGAGITLFGGATSAIIGGTGTNESNVIANNGGDGIWVQSGTGTRILGNTIYSNTGLGIDLGTNGVTNNDGGDGDSGPNNLMNFPVIYSVVISGADVTISGEARPGATVEFFESPDAAGSNGEGQTFIGRGTVGLTGTAGTNDATAIQFSFTFAVGSLVSGDRVTATATTVADGTSEFSVNVAANTAPVVAGAGSTLAYSEGDGAQVIDATLTITDVDDTNIESATISLTGGFVPGEDVLAFTNTGTITGVYNPATGILTLTGTDTLANYEAALESLTYENTNTNNPNTGTRTVSWVVNDGSANSAGTTSTITVAAVNDPPVATNDGYTVSEDTTLTADWWNANWTQRQQLTFNNTGQPENLTDFPVLIQLNASRIDYGQTQNAGQDLRFVDANGNLLAHEIESWNEAGTSYVWVKVPLITAASGTDFIRMYYGNAAAADGQNPDQVWANGYSLVHHLEETSGTEFDSTANNNDGVNNGPNQNVAGYLGSGSSFDGVNDVVTVAYSASLAFSGQITYEAWIRPQELSGYNIVLSKGTTGTDGYVWLSTNNTELNFGYYSSGYREYQTSGLGLQTNTWYHVAATFDDATNTVRTYVNGQQVLVNTSATQALSNTASNTLIGRSTLGEYWNGTLDEVRASSTVRSTAWLTAQHLAMTDSFVTHGPVQSNPSLVGVLANDSDAESSPIAATLVSGPSNAASFALSPNGMFSYTPVANFTGTDTFTYKANDGGLDSGIATVTITVTAVNDPPAFSGLDGTPSFTEGGSAVVLDANVTLSDAELSAANNFSGATLTLARNGGANSQDVFGATGTLSLSGGNVVLSGVTIGTYTNGSGTLAITFNASATGARVNSTLQQITYSNSSDTPPASAQIDWTFNDGNSGGQGTGGALTATGSTTVSITATNDAPVVTTTGTTLAYTENQAATAIDPALTVSDVDSTNLTGATVQITGNYASGQDVLAFTNQLGITGSWDAGTGVLTLTGATTLANYQTALRSVTYVNTSDAPSTLTRTVSFVVNDGTANSTAATRSISVTATNDPPVLSSASLTVHEGQTVPLLDTNFGITDPDNTSFTYTVSGISGGYFQLSSAAGTPITSFTSAQLSSGLVQFVDDGNEVAPAFSVTVNDGSLDSNTLAATITYNPINDAPVLTAGAPDVTFVEGGMAQVIDALFTVSDVDSADFAGGTLTVSITANGSAADRLQVGNFGTGPGQVGVSGANVTCGGVTVGSFTGGTDGSTPLVLTFNANATAAAVQEVARSIQFDNVSDTPSTLSRQVTFTLTDGDGGTAAPQVETVSVQATNDAPVFTVPPGTTAYTEGATVFVTPSATLTDVDSPDFDGGQLVLSITAGGESTDRLYVNSQGTGPGQVLASGANVFYNGGSGSVLVGTISGGYGASDPLVITFNGSSTPAAVAAITSQVLFWNTSDNPAATSRTVTLQVTDGDGGTSTLQTRTISVTPLNDAPAIAGLSGDSLAYSEGAGAVVIEQGGNATVTDVDSADFATGTLTVSFVAGSDSAEDVLGIRNDGTGAGQIGVAGANVTYGGVTIGTFTGGSGGADLVVTLNANSSAAAAQALIRNITYSNTDPGAPTTGSRTVRYELTDGDGGTSGSHDATVTVSAANDAPVLDSATLTVSEGQTVTVSGANFGITDPDSASFTYTVSGISGGYFQLSSAAGMPITSFSSAQLAGGLVQFVDDGNEVAPAFSVTVNDGALNSNTLAATVSYSPQNDAPVLSSASMTLNEGQTVTLSGANFGITDPDSASFTYTVSGVSGGYFQLSSAAGTPITTFTSAQLAGGLVQFVDDGNEVAPSFSVTVNDGTANSNTLAATISYTPQNDAPVITNDGGGASATVNVAENSTAVTTVTSADVDGGAPVYSIVGGADAALFGIDSVTGVLTFTTAPDFEAPADVGGNNVYDVTVQVSDGNGGTGTQAIAVAVTNVNEPPVITSNGGGVNANVNVAENTSAVTMVTSTDVDGGAPSYAIVGGADAALFSINTATGALSFVGAPDFEAPTDAGGNNIYDVTVQVADGNGGFDTQLISVAVTGVNDNAPVITSHGGGASAALSVAENSNAVAVIAALDLDLPTQALTYGIAGGADAAQFTINPSTGLLRFNVAPNFEAPGDADGNNVYDVTVQVTDGGGGFDSQAIGVTVTNVNEAPTGMAVSGGAVAENASAGTLVASIAGADPDAGETLAYSLVDDAGGRFSIDPVSGQINVASAAQLDFEAATSHSVVVRVTDAAGLSVDQTVAIAVSDVDDTTVLTPPGGSINIGLPPTNIGLPPTAQQGDEVSNAASSSKSKTNAMAVITAGAPAPDTGSAAIAERLVAGGRSEASESAARQSVAPLRTAALEVRETPVQPVREGFQLVANIFRRQTELYEIVSSAPALQNAETEEAVLRALGWKDGKLTLISSFGIARGTTVSVGEVVQLGDSAEEVVELARRNFFEDPVRLVGTAFAAGFVWWASRSGGLIAALAMGLPAWRHVDFLPVLAKDDDDEEDDDALDTPMNSIEVSPATVASEESFARMIEADAPRNARPGALQ
jgi:hypothetical protein